MNEDRIEGAFGEGVGALKRGFGGAVGDTNTQASGAFDEAKGQAQNLYGQAKDAVSNFTDKLPPNVKDGAAQAWDYAKDKPIAATLIAGTVGYLLAWALHGRD